MGKLMTNYERCKDCSNFRGQYSDWFYCNNPNNYRRFTIVRTSDGTDSPAPEWCWNTPEAKTIRLIGGDQ